MDSFGEAWLLDKKNCEEWKVTKSESSKKAILYSYNHNWFKVRLWKDNKLTFRITSIDFDWEPVIAGFLKTHPYLKYASISVSDQHGADKGLDVKLEL